MDIDKLFKVPKLPTGGNKRRMPDNPTPDMLKRLRTEASSFSPSGSSASPASNGSTKAKSSRSTTVRDEDEEDAEGDVSTDFAPGNDADYFAEEDEEGRFFGGGLTSEQKQILNIFESAGGEGAQQEDLSEITVTSARRILLRFERSVNKNQDQRSKYPDDPTKFIDSEADLDSAIKSLLPLAQAPQISFPELVKSGSIALLIGLLSHENADIMIDAVEVIYEFTDEDIGNEGGDDEEEDGQSREAALKLLIEAFLEHSILELLVDNLSRLNETEESDRQGVFHILGIFENLLGFNPDLAPQLVSKTSMLKWLLKRVEAKEHDENRGYAAELLSILLQNNRENRLVFGKADGVEALLKVLSQFRRKDPVDSDETEFMENVFDTLSSSLNEPEIKKMFLDAEGIDLMVLMMKEKRESSSLCLKVLVYAMAGPTGTPCCETFIEALGLKTLFTIFMGKGTKKSKSSSATAAAQASEDQSHTLDVVSSLFSNLASDSPARMRLLAKFVENNYEKPERLLELREQAQTKLRGIEKEVEAERKQMVASGEEVTEVEEDRWYLTRLSGGLYTLQTVDYIIAWICMEDDGIQSHVKQMLARNGKSFKDIVDVLKIFRDNIGDDDDKPAPPPDTDTSPPQRLILGGLIQFLEGI